MLVRPMRYSVAAVADGEEEVMKRLAIEAWKKKDGGFEIEEVY